MRLVKLFIASLLIAITFNANAQKVKVKKGIAYVDKKEYLKVEKINALKYFISTLENEEFLSVNIESFGTGKYHKTRNAATGQRSEIMHYYAVLKFLDNEEIGESFEVDEGRLKHLIKMMYNSNIIVDNKLSIKHIKRMIEKYSENVSERRFLTKN